MYIPFNYQVSEYDCVPTALINAVSYLFHRNEIPPMVIRHIYLYCLDTVGKNARFGIGGTSKYAVRLMGNWLSSYRIKAFSVRTEFIERETVCFERGGWIETCLEEGGIVLCNIRLSSRDEHYVMVMAVDEEWVYCFDSYLRVSVQQMKGNVKVLRSDDGRAPNLKIKRAWIDQTSAGRFCLGPLAFRESLLMWRTA